MLPLCLRSDSLLRSKPWMNWLLMGSSLGIFLLQRVGGVWADPPLLSCGDPRLISFLTYALFHLSWLHLLGNLLALYIFGDNVSDRLGPWGYLAFYAAGAVFAGAGFVLSYSAGQVMGASGAVGAVMGMYMALLPRSNITLLNVAMLRRTFEIPSMYFIGVYFLFNLIMSLTAQGEVAYVAHLAGMLFGFGVGLGLLAGRLIPRTPGDFLSLIQRRGRSREQVSRGRSA